MIELYQPDKYQVLLGEGKHIGLCTAWSDPSLIVHQQPQLVDTCVIIGTLYSVEGVNIMLRNLCLNPQITHVLVWARQPMSRTAIGKIGTDTLMQIWKNGVDENGSTGVFKLHPNIDPLVINKVVKNIELMDVSELELNQLPEVIKTIKLKESYMEPVRFPVYQKESMEKLPSEEIGWVVHGRKIADVFVKVIDRIVRYGIEKTDEYGMKIKELTSVTWVVDDEETDKPYIPEDWPQELRAVLGIPAAENVKEYIKTVFLSETLPPGSAYSYGERLRNYPLAEDRTVNQIKYIINKLKECETTRRAVAVLWHPGMDTDKLSPPCIIYIQAIQSEGKLNLYAVIRSHDYFKADMLNGFGLRAIQEEIAHAAGLSVGKLSVTINSAHIYEDDWKNARMLVKCAIWDRPVDMVFRESDADPRGNVIIRVLNGKIVADFTTPSGEQLMTITGNSAKEVYKKIVQLDLLSRHDHMMNIGTELQKAEIARDVGIEYKQDYPLIFRN